MSDLDMTDPVMRHTFDQYFPNFKIQTTGDIGIRFIKRVPA